VMQYLWPFRGVRQWQRGCYYVCGRYWRTVGPGEWPVIPYFMNVIAVDVVPSIISTPLQTITLRDKRLAAFSATATLLVEDPRAALNDVDKYEETVAELVASVLAERIADADPERFDPAYGKRDRLLEELRVALDDATRVFGVRVLALRFTNFMTDVRTYRLLAERATLLAS